MNTHPARLRLLALALLASACSSAPVAERYYRLDAGEPPTPPLAAGFDGDVTLLLDSIPERIDRPQLTLVEGAGSVIVADDARWAEPLRGAVTRVLTERIAHALPQAWVSQTLPGHPHRSCTVTVELDALDAQRGGSARLDARWTVRGADGQVLRSQALHRSLVPTAADPSAAGLAAAVAAWNSELGMLAEAIAHSVADVMGGQPPGT